jgi:hypothetical protein
MDPLELEPRYSTREIPGRCIKCLADHEVGSCLRLLLGDETNNKEIQQRYKALVDFIHSPELVKVRDECERYLAQGKEVSVILHLGRRKPQYEIKLV